MSFLKAFLTEMRHGKKNELRELIPEALLVLFRNKTSFNLLQIQAQLVLAV